MGSAFKDLVLVQSKLRANGVNRKEGRKSDAPPFLTGILFDAANNPMTPTHAVKKGFRYRYYVSRHLVTGAKSDDAGQTLPATAIETLVLTRRRAYFADPDAIASALPAVAQQATERKRAVAAAAGLIGILNDTSNASREPFLRSVLERVQVQAEMVEIKLQAPGLETWILGEHPKTTLGTSRSEFLAPDDANRVETDFEHRDVRLPELAGFAPA